MNNYLILKEKYLTIYKNFEKNSKKMTVDEKKSTILTLDYLLALMNKELNL
tara:strand:- start:14 stop:166 length:153 start_codon:yes stop_codon:yes gene_type:complete